MNRDVLVSDSQLTVTKTLEPKSTLTQGQTGTWVREMKFADTLQLTGIGTVSMEYRLGRSQGCDDELSRIVIEN